MAKAGRPKKGTAGLPAWFDIQKYRCVEDFRAWEWFEQLAARHALAAFADLMENEGKNLQNELKEAFALIRQSPEITVKRILRAPLKTIVWQNEKVEIVDPALGCVLPTIPQTNIGVSDVGLSETTQLVLSLQSDWRLTLAAQLSWDLLPPADMPSMYKNVSSTVDGEDQFFAKLFDKWGTSLARIDLSLPDQVLMKDFAAYLKDKRKRLPRPEQHFFKNPDFAHWFNSGVLAYLDLALWERASGETIRWSAFANALDDIANKSVCGESTLSKTTKAYARKLLNESTIKILLSQAMREKSSSGKKSNKMHVR